MDDECRYIPLPQLCNVPAWEQRSSDFQPPLPINPTAHLWSARAREARVARVRERDVVRRIVSGVREDQLMLKSKVVVENAELIKDVWSLYIYEQEI